MDNKKMIIEVMALQSLSRSSILEIACKNDRKIVVPPVRGTIKRKIFILLYQKLKRLGRLVVHYLPSNTDRQQQPAALIS
ncbi:hypothetical protein JCGZ_12190 [Jatropha curcas]|uniref:Uncharacterized protein n=1 Tax=Jatropha curcas TaxID=180498 RepID=A0A067KD03_JATCU|nr:hypothetical protein JCGZ_12190 [Jatropha curcas]QMV49343.1 flowering peptide [Jatropha curcas]